MYYCWNFTALKFDLSATKRSVILMDSQLTIEYIPMDIQLNITRKVAFNYIVDMLNLKVTYKIFYMIREEQQVYIVVNILDINLNYLMTNHTHHEAQNTFEERIKNRQNQDILLNGAQMNLL